MNALTNQIIRMNLNNSRDEITVNSRVNRDPNEITHLIETVSNDYQSSIILNLFTDYSNKMYLIDHRENLFKIEINLLGSKKLSTREKYTIVFNKLHCNFTCNCKDFIYRSKIRDIVCKHITFIICKVLGIYDNKFFETKKLSPEYQKKMCKIIGNSSSIWYNNDISIKHLNSEFKNCVKTLNTEDSCPICCDVFGSENTIISCPECKGYIHKNCMDIWIETSKTCVYCRSEIFKDYISDVSKI